MRIVFVLSALIILKIGILLISVSVNCGHSKVKKYDNRLPLYALVAERLMAMDC